jgi:hypothetical protein
MSGCAPLAADIRLELHITAPRLGVGDLDNFVTGVCDGLQAAGARADLAPAWARPDLALVHPRRVIAIQNDSAVVEIRAIKTVAPEPAHYRIVLEGLV